MIILFGCYPDREDVTKVRENNLEQWSEEEIELYQMFNDYRGTELTSDKNIREECIKRFIYLSENDLVSHEGFTEALTNLSKLGFEGISEILAYGYTSTDSVFEAFVGSEDHNQIIKSPNLKYIGVYIQDKYFIAILAR